MDDDLDSNTCEICLLPFNNSNHLPKIIECCKHAFCLQCLNQIYAKNNNKLMCSICRKFTNMHPNSLATDQSRLVSQKPKCPTCKKETEVNSFLVKLSDNSQAVDFIFCSKCVELDLDNKINSNIINLGNNISLNNMNYYNIAKQINSSIFFENMPLQEFLDVMKIELNCFSNEKLQLFQSLNANNNNKNIENTKKTEEILDLKIMTFVDNYFEKLKRNIKVKIKQFMRNYLFEELGFSFEMEQGRKIDLDFINKISTFISEVNSIASSKLKEADIAKINKAIKFYLRLNSIEVLIQKISSVRSFVESLSFNFAISNNEKFEDLIVDNLELKQNNELFFSNAENFAMKNSGVEFFSGIQLIDNEFLKLKRNLDNYALCFSDSGSLRQENEELVKQLSELENKNNILARNFSNVLNENLDLSEANKKLEQQLSDLFVKNEANIHLRRVRELQEKLKESEVLLSKQKLFNAELKKHFEQCLMEINKIKKEKQILENEKEMIKGEIKINDKVVKDFNANDVGDIKWFNNTIAIFDDINYNPNLPNKRAKSDIITYHSLNDGSCDIKKNVYEDINSNVGNERVQEPESEGRKSRLHNKSNLPGAVDDSRLYPLTERNNRSSTPNTDQADNDEFSLFGRW